METLAPPHGPLRIGAMNPASSIASTVSAGCWACRKVSTLAMYKLASQYIAKVETFRQAQQPAETVEAIEEAGFIAPILNGPWGGANVSISHQEMAELRQRLPVRG